MLLWLSLLVLLLHVWGLMALTRQDEVQTQARPLMMEVSLLAAPQQPVAAPAAPAPAPVPPPVKKVVVVKKPQPLPKKKLPVVEKKTEAEKKFEPSNKPELIAKTKPLAPSTSEAVTKSVAPIPVTNPVVTAPTALAPTNAVKEEPITKASIGATYGETPGKRYPAIARRRGWEGTVLLKVQLSAEGASEHVAVERSSGHEILDEAAVDMVKKWKFIPAKRGDTLIASSVKVPIIFKLDN